VAYLFTATEFGGLAGAVVAYVPEVFVAAVRAGAQRPALDRPLEFCLSTVSPAPGIARRTRS